MNPLATANVISDAGLSAVGSGCPSSWAVCVSIAAPRAMGQSSASPLKSATIAYPLRLRSSVFSSSVFTAQETDFFVTCSAAQSESAWA